MTFSEYLGQFRLDSVSLSLARKNLGYAPVVDQATWASEAGAGGRPSFEAAQWFKI